jgi:hypothetical protein
MSIEQLLPIVPVAVIGGGVLLRTIRSQRLATSSIIITSASLSRERLEELFVRYIANRGHDRWRSAADRIASQPSHFGWTLELRFAESHDEVGRPVMVAETYATNVRFIPFPRKYPFWQVPERWDEMAWRMRGLIKAISTADPDADVAVVPAMFT